MSSRRRRTRLPSSGHLGGAELSRFLSSPFLTCRGGNGSEPVLEERSTTENKGGANSRSPVTAVSRIAQCECRKRSLSNAASPVLVLQPQIHGQTTLPPRQHGVPFRPRDLVLLTLLYKLRTYRQAIALRKPIRRTATACWFGSSPRAVAKSRRPSIYQCGACSGRSGRAEGR